MRKPCCEKEDVNKGAWSQQEDQMLIDYINKHGEGHWRNIPKAAGLLRCGKSCRLRWINYLRPDLKRGNFAEDEEDLIIRLHALLGNRWSLIAGRLPGRTDNEVKNYWNSHLSKKLTSMGIDPKHHRLSHYIARPRTHDLSTGETSSALKDHQLFHHQIKSSSGRVSDHQISDAGSCIDNDHDDDSGALLPDLNIDITADPSLQATATTEERAKLLISLPSGLATEQKRSGNSPSSGDAIEENIKYNQRLIYKAPEIPICPTFALFR